MPWFRNRDRPARQTRPSPAIDPLDLPLLHFPTGDEWTQRDAFSGTLVTGATGAGKTSGPGQSMALAMLEAGWGGLILAAKNDEAALWREYARRAGREESLIVVDDSMEHRFNFMQHTVAVAPNRHILTINLVGLYGAVMEAINGSSEVLDDYWSTTRDQLLTNAFEVVLAAYGTADLDMADKLILSAPTDVSQLRDEQWQADSACMQALELAFQSVDQDDDVAVRSLNQAASFLLNEYPKLADRTRSSIVSTFRSASDLLNRGLLWKLFSTDTTYVPEACRKGAIIVVDLPVHTYQKAGVIAQVLLKHVWQKAMQHPMEGESRPVFLWVDEYHHFAVQADATFQSTARGYEVATVYMFQNLPILYAAMGGPQAEPFAKATVGNLRTCMFGANAEPTTNQWASDMIGHKVQRLASGSTSIARQEGGEAMDWLISGKDEASISSQAGFSEQVLPQVQPEVFTRLRVGGPQNDWSVDAVVFQTGRTFGNGKTFQLVAFPQKT